MVRTHTLRRCCSGAHYQAFSFRLLLFVLLRTVRTDRLKHLYTRAMQLEVNFFSAQPGTPRPSEYSQQAARQQQAARGQQLSSHTHT